MKPLNHYFRGGFYFPRVIPYRGKRMAALCAGKWRVYDEGSCIYACPTIDGEDMSLVTFDTIKDAKMGIDRYISWAVPYRLAFDARST